jgi:hypothetical protein
VASQNQMDGRRRVSRMTGGKRKGQPWLSCPSYVTAD